MNTSLAMATWAGYFKPLQGITHDEDAALKKEFSRLQIPVTFVDWATKGYPWRSNQHPAILVKSTWRYEDTPNRFIRWLKQLQHEALAKTINPPPFLQWNVNKAYLGDLSEKGITTPNTIYCPSGTPVNLITERVALLALQSDKIIIKPAISAASKQVTLLTSQQIQEDALAPIIQQFNHRPFLVQAFEPTIKTLGEKQAVAVNGEILHSVKIMPAADNFVSQHSKGATREPYTLTQPETTFVQKVLQALPHNPTYARIDFFTRNTGEPVLNEVEGIEPPLYLDSHEKSLQTFCATMAKHYTHLAETVTAKTAQLFT
jgi:glutathione synthase/RimK-type ligase-like ATP-grasp enzyme